MTDSFGREINYMRLSVTDRCNLRCSYCMPGGAVLAAHEDLLTYEEILRVCEAAVALGITRFKVTGGEPLVRRGSVGFIARLAALPGVRQVTLTTNGLLLEEHIEALAAAGIACVNLSLDTLDDDVYAALTGHRLPRPAAAFAEAILNRCAEFHIPAKINAVLLPESFGGITALAALAQRRAVDVRFIELMPIGEGAHSEGVPMAAALARLKERWPLLAPSGEKRGNGPALVYSAPGLAGHIGFIGAMSHGFCHACNRVRLTSTGRLKPCLASGESADLRALLRGGAEDEALREALRAAVRAKPAAHGFSAEGGAGERRSMNEIGG